MTILIYAGIILASLIAAFIIELAIAAFYPNVTVLKQPLATTSPKPQVSTGKKVTFQVNGIEVNARLFLPEKMLTPVPCVIMAHGLGGTMNMGLEVYATRFSEAGMAVLMFDYRYMGTSGGEPRQLIWIPSQLEDYTAAINYARQLKGIDPDRIALWGTSLSGGHVLVTASKDNKISCVCAQCPLLDGTEAAEAQIPRTGIKYIFRMAAHGQRDLVRSWFNMSPHKIPIVGKPGTVALMADSDAWKAFEQLAPEDYVNEACARICIRMDKYRPISTVDKILCPMLIQVCDSDIALPSAVVEKAEKKLGSRAQFVHYPIGHFDIYLGANQEKAIADQLAFFRRHLLKG